MKTKLEIIEETAAFYSEDASRRAVDDEIGVCCYLTKDGRKCAVGRFLKNPEKFPSSYGVGCIAIEDFQEDYQINDGDFLFWQELQSFHDMKEHWYANGLTESGLKRLNELKIKYS